MTFTRQTLSPRDYAPYIQRARYTNTSAHYFNHNTWCPTNMIYELRIYTCFSGKLPNLNNRFANHTLALFEKHGIKNIGYWINDVGPSNNELVYLVAFDDHNQRAKAWSDFRADPEWQRVFEESHRDGIIVENVENRLLTPTPYSPMQ